MKKLLRFTAIAVVALVLLEIALRIHNPFGFTVKRGRIVLPANKTYIVETRRTRAPDRVLHNHRNSLGLRGEEPPSDDGRTRIITMGGGSTAENGVTDGKTWTDGLGVLLSRTLKGVWINNAGFAGLTTIGMKPLLEDIVLPLKPKMVIILVGVTDIHALVMNAPELDMMRDRYDFSSPREFLFSASRNIEVVALAVNSVKRVSGHAMFFGNAELDFNNLKTLSMTPEGEAAALRDETEPFVAAYRERVLGLAATCRQAGAIPVFVTQPVVYGAGKDDVTGADLETMDAGHGLNGRVAWKILERYNDQLRELAKSGGLNVIDVARLLPKSSRYFFAPTLTTEEGSAEVARLIEPDVVRLLETR